MSTQKVGQTQQFEHHNLLKEVSAPPTPSTGYVAMYAKSDGKIYRKDDAGTESELGGSAAASARAVGVTIDGAGSAISTGVKGYIVVPFAGTITRWDLVADQVGSIVLDVWKDTYANYPPTVADTIAGTEKPTLSSAIKNQDTTLSTWTTSVAAGDVIAFNVDSASTVTKVTLTLWVTPT